MKINGWQEHDKLQHGDLVQDAGGTVWRVWKERHRDEPEETYLQHFGDDFDALLNDRLTSVPFPLTLVGVHEIERES